MEQFELLRAIVEVVDSLRLQYFVTGSNVTIFFGEPRFTNDIDIVVELPMSKVDAFCSRFPSTEYYVSVEAARAAVAQVGQFNIIQPSTGLKVDVMIPDRSEFNRSRMMRARRISPSPGLEAMFASPEDAIIKKLDYFREGGSEKHLRDIAGVLRISGETLDRSYIDQWVAKFGLEQEWAALLKRVGSP